MRNDLRSVSLDAVLQPSSCRDSNRHRRSDDAALLAPDAEVIDLRSRADRTSTGATASGPDEDDWSPVRDERRVSIDQIAAAGKVRYTYDFGDNWEHDVIVEKTLPADRTATVPDCIDWRRGCPPEDRGGPWGYAEPLKTIKLGDWLD